MISKKVIQMYVKKSRGNREGLVVLEDCKRRVKR